MRAFVKSWQCQVLAQKGRNGRVVYGTTGNINMYSQLVNGGLTRVRTYHPFSTQMEERKKGNKMAFYHRFGMMVELHWDLMANAYFGGETKFSVKLLTAPHQKR